MNEQELRAIVRAAVARHLHPDAPCAPVATSSHPWPHPLEHASHVLYHGLVTVSDACVIEPAVKCDHCGYCKSQGY